MLSLFASFAVQAQCYTLVWSDEFEENGLPDSSKWSYNVGGHGWGNQELQYYTEKRLENARVEDGNLIIEAIKENYEGSDYTSARLVSKEKGDWLYGRIEVKAKLPGGTGIWPAIWMLSADNSYGGWPESGEIDIMEYVGYQPGVVHGTVHTDAFNHSIGTQKGDQIEVPDAETDFHVYAIEWTEEKIDFFVDDQKYFTFNNTGGDYEEWPFDKRFYLVLNVAVGGTWGGSQGVNDDIFPQRMEIDYVRAYTFNEDFKIEGKNTVYPGEGNLNYSVPYGKENQYTWLLPDDAVLLAGADSNFISLNWGCTEGTIKCLLNDTCRTDTIELDVTFEETIAISGDFFFSDSQEGLSFSFPGLAEAEYHWSLPQGAEIIEGDSTGNIMVNWGTNPGKVSLNLQSKCINESYEWMVYRFGKYPYPDPAQPKVLPGKIQAVEYDYGGEGLGYHDTDTVNEGPGPRQDEGVDTEYNNNDNPNVGWINSGEWLEFSVIVTEPGEYYIKARVATNNGTGGPISVYLNGELVIESEPVKYSGGWNQFETIFLPDAVTLGENDTLIRIGMGNGMFNLAWIEFTTENLPVDIQNTGINDLTVFPNPVSDIFYLEKKIIVAKAILIDTQGRQYKIPELRKGYFNIQRFSPGLYILKLTGEDGKQYIKRIIKK